MFKLVQLGFSIYHNKRYPAIPAYTTDRDDALLPPHGIHLQLLLPMLSSSFPQPSTLAGSLIQLPTQVEALLPSQLYCCNSLLTPS